jgi:hypothetical protein
MLLEELPEHLRDRVAAELEPGEKIFWIDQPRPSRTITWVFLFPSLFAIPWTGFTLFWIAGAIGVFDKGQNLFRQLDIQRLFFGAFGIPFLLIGIAMFFSPFWTRKKRLRAARETVYLITGSRAIIMNAGYLGDSLIGTLAGKAVLGIGRAGYIVASYSPNQLRNIQRVQHTDGTGDVAFGQTIFETESNSENKLTRDGFFSVPEAREVEKLLKVLAGSNNPANPQA